jgi:hypothetical protein
LLLGNIFEVSIDYLLKDTVVQESNTEKGYYVSKEMAEGFLAFQGKTHKYVSLGVSLLILSTIPYWLFDPNKELSTFLIILIATIGVGALVSAVLLGGHQYKVLSKEPLLLDHHYVKELSLKYAHTKKKYAVVMIVGSCLSIEFKLSQKPSFLENDFRTSQIVLNSCSFSVNTTYDKLRLL